MGDQFVQLRYGAVDEVGDEHGLSWGARSRIRWLLESGAVDRVTGESGPLTITAIAAESGASWRAVKRELDELADAGLADVDMPRGHDGWVRLIGVERYVWQPRISSSDQEGRDRSRASTRRSRASTNRSRASTRRSRASAVANRRDETKRDQEDLSRGEGATPRGIAPSPPSVPTGARDRDDIVEWLVDVAGHCDIPTDEVYDVVDGPTGRRLIDAARPLVYHPHPVYRDPAKVAAAFYDYGGQPRYASGLLKVIRKVAAEAAEATEATEATEAGVVYDWLDQAPSGPLPQPIAAIGDRVAVPGFPTDTVENVATGTVEKVVIYDTWNGKISVDITVRFDHAHYVADYPDPIEDWTTVQEEWIEWGMTVIDDTTDTTEEAIA